ncbi:MAG: alpha/beta hydrolase [Actinomyces sp.]|uniref:alpha/beta hydrolase n=1 Tax=Actinomyces sp. TaxID=29317 RepID=UPI0025DCE64C|nr:alpha/beta hydrolase [Actinomyces sp.]MDU1430206.1 alpha/beta hydrolase [Actinomyces sp.]
MVSWSEVQKWNAGVFTSLAQQVGDSAEGCKSNLKRFVDVLAGFDLEGATASAARDQGRFRIEAARRQVEDLRALQEIFLWAEHEVSDIAADVTSIHEIERTTNITISESGAVAPRDPMVFYGRNNPFVDDEPALQFASTRIASLLSRAEAFISELEARFSRVNSGEAGAEHAYQTSDNEEAQLPPPGSNPRQIAAWWGSLSPQQQEELIKKYPEIIGNLDGVDIKTRDRVNRSLVDGMLTEARDRERQTHDDLVHLGMTSHSYANRYSKALDDVEDLEVLQEVLKDRERKLLVCDRSGERLKVAIGIGDFGTAEHVGVFVPGMGTTVRGSLLNYVTKSEGLNTTAQGLRKSSYATVAWLGYDAPLSIPNVANTHRANAGADRLENFLEGLKATFEEKEKKVHLTLLGHSYGSTTSGIAASHVQPNVVDDLVLFGSPGSGVQLGAEYRVPEGHRWVSAVPYYGDIVQGIGTDINFGRNPTEMPAFRHISGDATEGETYRTFTHPFGNHSTYLENNTETQKDMARILAGLEPGS